MRHSKDCSLPKQNSLVATARIASQRLAVYFDRIQARWDILAARRWSLIEKWILAISSHTSVQLKLKTDTLCVEKSKFSGVSAAGRICKHLFSSRDDITRFFWRTVSVFQGLLSETIPLDDSERVTNCLLRLANTRSCSQANKIPQKLSAQPLPVYGTEKFSFEGEQKTFFSSSPVCLPSSS